MVLGQALDIKAETSKTKITIEKITNLQSYKTGKLISWSCEVGAILSNEDRSPFKKFASCIGLAFQIQDDILDVIGTSQSLGKKAGKDKYQNVRIGMTGRLDSMQAVILDAKLDIFEDELTLRQTVADRYHTLLGDMVGTPQLASGATSSWAQYCIKLPHSSDRAAVISYLGDHGVPTAIYYPVPMHQQPPYKDFPQSQCGLGVTCDLSARVLALPMHPYLEDTQQQHIAAQLRHAL